MTKDLHASNGARRKEPPEGGAVART
jgi:hypothetical protein